MIDTQLQKAFNELLKRKSFTVADVDQAFIPPDPTWEDKEYGYRQAFLIVEKAKRERRVRWNPKEKPFLTLTK